MLYTMNKQFAGIIIHRKQQGEMEIEKEKEIL